MKLSKKIVALLVAVAMLISVFAMAACKKHPLPEGGTNTGNGGGNHNTTEVLTEEEKFINALGEISSLSCFKGTFTTDWTTEDGDGLVNEVTETNFNTSLREGDADITKTYTYTSGALKKTDISKTYMRRWQIFSEEEVYDESEDAYVKSGKILYEDNLGYYITNELRRLTWPYDPLDVIAELAPAVFSDTLVILSSIANAADALTIEDKTVTLNANLMAYNVASDLSALAESVNSQTTVQDVLTSNHLKKYLMVFTEMIPVEVLQAILASLKDVSLADLVGDVIAGMYPDVPDEALKLLMNNLAKTSLSDLAKIEPDSGSTTFDYILKILSSTELAFLLKSTVKSVTDAMQPSVSDPDAPEIDVDALLAQIVTVTAIPLSFLSNFGVSEEMIAGFIGMARELVESNIERDSLIIPIVEDYTDEYGYCSTTMISFSDTSLEFTLSNAKTGVTAVKESATVNVESETVYYTDDGEVEDILNSAESGTLSAEIEFLLFTSVVDINDRDAFWYSDYTGHLYPVDEDGELGEFEFYVSYDYDSDEFIFDLRLGFEEYVGSCRDGVEIKGETYEIEYEFIDSDRIELCLYKNVTIEEREVRVLAYKTEIARTLYIRKVSDLISWWR